MKQDESDFSMKMTKILEHLISEKKFKLPFLVTAVGINGSCLFFKYWEAQAGLRAKLITGHVEDRGFGLPINMMVVDARGKGLSLIIQKPPDKYEMANCVGHA